MGVTRNFRCCSFFNTHIDVCHAGPDPRLWPNELPLNMSRPHPTSRRRFWHCRSPGALRCLVIQKSPLGEFINAVIVRMDKRMRAFEGTLVRTLRSVSSWLLPAAFLTSTSLSESDSSGTGIHPSIPQLFAVSHLPSMMYAFLSHTLGAECDWVVHSKIYVALMDVIKHLKY